MSEWETLHQLPAWLRTASLDAMIVLAETFLRELEHRRLPARDHQALVLAELIELRDAYRAARRGIVGAADPAIPRRPGIDQPLDFAADG